MASAFASSRLTPKAQSKRRSSQSYPSHLNFQGYMGRPKVVSQSHIQHSSDPSTAVALVPGREWALLARDNCGWPLFPNVWIISR